MSCPDLLLLSQLLDAELPAAEASAVAAHVGDCEPCTVRIARLRRALAAASVAARGASPAPLTGDGSACPPAGTLAGWRDPAVPAGERAALGRHLDACDHCLGEVLAAACLLARLDAAPAIPVPAALRARLDEMLAGSAVAPSLSELVVRVGRAGAELLESRLLAPLRELTLVPSPLAAVRGGVDAGALSFELRAPAAVITTTVVDAGDAVVLTLALADEAGGPLADLRVHLRRQGRALYSARTDADGTLRLPGIERGVYEVACPGLATAFRLDLRP